MTEPAGFLAEFETAEDLLRAARRAREEGYRRLDAYAPLPVHGLAEALGQKPSPLPLIALLGGAAGGATGYALQYLGQVVAYPLIVGGKPPHSWPAFVPVSFESAILIAALSVVGGFFALNNFPYPYHPAFNVEKFERASQDRFFLEISSSDGNFDLHATRSFLESLKPAAVHEMEP
jgi:hypothetical protein